MDPVPGVGGQYPACVVASPTSGRRERRKARTRAAIVEAATTLFLERGFDGVTVAEIAEHADVAVSTVFNYFPTKEALVFDEDVDRETGLVEALRCRTPGTSVIEALHHYLRSVLDDHQGHALATGIEHGVRSQAFRELALSTPRLREYAHRTWTRHENALAAALAADVGTSASDPHVRALAHLVIETQGAARYDTDDPYTILDASFAILARGWEATAPGAPDMSE